MKDIKIKRKKLLNPNYYILDSKYNIFFDSHNDKKFIMEIWLCDLTYDEKRSEIAIVTVAPINNSDYIAHYLPKDLNFNFKKYLPFDDKTNTIRFLRESNMRHITKFEENICIS